MKIRSAWKLKNNWKKPRIKAGAYGLNVVTLFYAATARKHTRLFVRLTATQQQKSSLNLLGIQQVGSQARICLTYKFVSFRKHQCFSQLRSLTRKYC